MVASFVQTRRADPLNAPALVELSKRLAAAPGDAALRDQVRQLDRLARRAFFADQRFLRTGAWLLLFGAGVWVAAVRLLRDAAAATPDPKARPAPADAARLRARGRWAVAATAAALVAIGLFAIRSAPPAIPPALPSPTPLPDTPAPPIPSPQSRIQDPKSQIASWPAFRGPHGNGIAACTNAPTSWDGASGSNVLWKVAVPRPGFSSPIVWGDRVFLTGADAATREVFCFNAADGALVWRGAVKDVPGTPMEPPRVSDDTGHAAPTPATDGQRVYAVFGNGDLAAFDFAGRLAWSRNLGAPDNNYGYASSPVPYGDRLFVQYDQANGARVLAIDTRTGRTVWEKTRDVNPSWATPLLVDTGARRELVLTADPWVISYHPDTGAEWWRLDCMGGEVGASPAFGGGKVFVANANVRLAAIGTADGKQAWEVTEDLPEATSPLATEQVVLIGTSYGVVSAYATGAGTRLWKHEFDTGFYASPVLVGDTVYLMDLNGVMRIFRGACDYAAIGSPALGEKSACTPAVVDGRLYVRGARHLFCIGAR